MSQTAYEDRHWNSADGLQLHFRDYPRQQARADEAGDNEAGEDEAREDKAREDDAREDDAGEDDAGEDAAREDDLRPVILCIPGQTRNARDFEPVADAFAGEWRVIAVDLRGRGDSDYAKDPVSYAVSTYVEDIAALIEQEGLASIVLVGTSLGGIVAMMLAARLPEKVAGVIVNDVGPEVESAGLRRISEYVGQGRSFPTWLHAARTLKDQAEEAYPDYQLSDWLTLAKRLMCIGGNGRISFDYDMRIAEPLSRSPAVGSAGRADGGPLEPGEMWAAWRALAGRPVLAVRGELSDLLSTDTLAMMKRELPGMESVTVPRIGHAPTLAEPEASEAIARLLAQLA